MRQGLAPSPWKKRVVSIGHLLLPFLDCRAVLAHAAGLALYHPFGAFSLAPLSFAVVGNCVGVQEYKGSFFLSFSQPALSFACHLTSLLHVLPFRSWFHALSVIVLFLVRTSCTPSTETRGFLPGERHWKRRNIINWTGNPPPLNNTHG